MGLYYKEVAEPCSALLSHPLQPLCDFRPGLAVPLGELIVVSQVLPARAALSQTQIGAGAHLELGGG